MSSVFFFNKPLCYLKPLYNSFFLLSKYFFLTEVAISKNKLNYVSAFLKRPNALKTEGIEDVASFAVFN